MYMQIDFTAEQEVRLSKAASNTGVNLTEYVKSVTLRFVDEELAYRTFVEDGVESAERGEFVEPTEVWRKVQDALRSGCKYVGPREPLTISFKLPSTFEARAMTLPNESQHRFTTNAPL